jgi:2'-5' RNA ligase
MNSGFNQIIMPIESALVVLIPEAEDLIGTFRKRYEPPAASSIPAHVTILYPFKSPEQLTSELVTTLRELFSKQAGFTTSFLEVQRFPDMLYLAPEPAEPFRQLTEMIVKHFPDTPPYGGAFPEIIPHLTIVQFNDPQQLDQIAPDFLEAARDILPIHASINTVSLIENSNGDWQICAQFFLRADRKRAGDIPDR